MKSKSRQIKKMPFLLMASILTGCSNEQAQETAVATTATASTPTPSPVVYESLTSVDITGRTLEEAKNEELSVQYPDEEWSVGSESPFVFSYEDTEDEEVITNVSLQFVGAVSKSLADSDRQTFVEKLKDDSDGITVQKSAMYLLEENPVIYVEVTTKLTESLINQMIDEGIWDEETLKAYGGKEALLAIDETNQLFIYAEKDNNLYLYTGTYHTESQKEECLELISVLHQTLKMIS